MASPSFFSKIIDFELSKDNLFLNPDEITFLQNVIKDQPEILSSIIAKINAIFNDGNIHYHDIPKIVLLLSTVYKEHLLEKPVENVALLNIVKFSANTLLKKDVIPLPELDLVIIQKLIDSSIDLLKMEIEIVQKEEKICFSFFHLF